MVKLSARALLLASLGIPAMAQAQDASPAAATNDNQQAQIQALQDQIKTMQAQLDAIKAGMVKQTPQLEKSSWAAGTKVSGKAFMNLSYIDHEADGVNQADNGVQTDVKRFYVTVEHSFDKTFSANITTDFRYNSKGLSNDTTVFVKKAYLQAKLSDAAIFRVGAADLPWVPFAEDVYGYRYVENVLVDRTRYGTSTDWGVHFSGSALGGKLSYAASAINGGGFKTLARNSDSIDLEGRIAFKPINVLTFAVGAYSGKLGRSNAQTATQHRATRFNALAAYTGERFRAGVEYFKANNWNNVTTAQKDETTGWSAFGSFAVNDKVSIFGRYDWVNPNKKTNAALDENYFNVGASYAVTKGVDLALVYKRDKATDGTIATSNGVIGGVDDGTYNELGLWTQLKF
jgi:hypothetical protein